ncbi:MAG: ABC transporter ATP-binding protein [Syntrophobacterales bacterium]|nr:ABC transporter ATP-binding protein [Syntrophobacterales bacterium]
MKRPLLNISGLSKSFGGLKAVEGVSFNIEQGEILGLLGPNGAGKTVCFNLISGIYKPTAGQIFLNARRIDGLAPHAIANLGIGRTFQIVKPFANLTVLENVIAARGITRYRSTLKIWSGWKTPAERRGAMNLLEKVGLPELSERRAGLLPLGNLRRLEIARALAVGHKLLLLDESFSGLRHEEIAQLEALIRVIREDGLTVLLIEHNMRVAMGLCDRLVVLEHGSKLTEGTPAEVRANEAVIEAYLGRKGSAHAA